MKLLGRSSARRVLLGVLWLAFNLTFPARPRPLPGTPYILRIQPGVAWSDVQLASESLWLSDGDLARVLGRTTTRPLDVKLARFSPCVPFLPLRRTGTAVADDELCLNTAYRAWPTARRECRSSRTSIFTTHKAS